MKLKWKRPKDKYAIPLFECDLSNNFMLHVYEDSHTHYLVRLLNSLSPRLQPVGTFFNFFEFEVIIKEDITIKELFDSIEEKLISYLNKFEEIKKELLSLFTEENIK